MIGEHRVITFELTDVQNDAVRRNLPVQDYALFDTDAPTDLIAISAPAIIINSAALDQDSIEMLWDFYSQVNGCTDETVIWLGEPKPPAELRKYLKCYASFAEIEGKLKYLLLDAHTKSKKSNEFSKSILYALKILAEIRKRPRVTSRQLADLLEISVRSVQRYIETLRCAGEWIEYDTTQKGWKLLGGGSVLFFDVKEDTNNPFNDGLLEVTSLQQELSKYGISVFDLPAASPKADKSKAACKRVVHYVQSQPSLCQSILNSGVLPAKSLTAELGVPKKIFERHKKYILAGLLICEHDYALMQQYFK